MKVSIKTKKLTLWSCLLALLFSMFVAACGTTPADPNKPVELTLWSYPSAGEVGNPPPDWFFVKTVREKLNIDLKVSFVPYGDDGDTKFNAAAAGNTMPDLFQIPSNNNLFLQWVNLGLIAPVDDLFALMPERTKDRYSDPVMQQLVTIGGKRYVLQEKAGLNKRPGLFIRRDWLDKLGLQPPTTLDEFLEVAKAFTTRDPDGNGRNDTYGFSTTITRNTTGLGGNFRTLFGAYGLPGIWNYKTPGEISLSVRDPGYLKVVEFLKEMVAARAIDPDWTTLNTDDFRSRWKQGRVGIMAEDFCAGLCEGNYQAFDASNPSGKWEVLAPPKGPDGTSFMGDYTNVGLRMAVSKKALDAGKGPAIAKFLEWTNKGEGYYLAAFGLEGEHYKLDEQGNVTTEGVPVPFHTHEAAPLNQLRALVYNNSQSELKSRYQSFKTKDGRTIDPVEIYNTIGKYPWQDQTSSYVIQPASNQADINRYIGENLVQFITNQKPLNAGTWDTFIKGLDNLNVSQWEEQANKNLKDQKFL